MWCGEVLPTPSLVYWMQRLPHARFTNLYGPTETTISSSYYDVPRCPEDARAPIPIGRPIPGEELRVLDGELCIGGAGLSPGYWRDAQKTAAAFVPDPANPRRRLYRTGDLARLGEDGLLYFLGRADTQVKSRGHRIELGEVETALHALPALADGAVVALASDGFEGATICCANVAGPGTDPGPATHRRALGARLPAYMLPSRWLRLDRLPVTANGKTDRVALRELFRREAAGA
jgi:acyl-coenzyme A synthetase/AMP-(fatty) acid ligase